MKYLVIPIVVVCLGLLVFVTPQTDKLWAQENLESKIIKMEKSRWEGWKNHDATPYDNYLAKEAVWVTGMGIRGKAQLLEGASEGWGCDVKSYDFSDWKLHRIADDTIIITHKASQDVICGENKLPTVIYGSTVYVRQGDSWLAAFHQESPALE